jgi:hypothetical protein
LREIAPDAGEQHIIFDPIPQVDGIEASADPLFEPRADVFLMRGGSQGSRRALGAQAVASEAPAQSAADFVSARPVASGRRSTSTFDLPGIV